MTVGKAIFYLLDNSTDLTAIVGTRIYPEVAQQDAPLPYVVYNISNNEPSDTKFEPSKLDTANIEVNCYSTSYTEVIDMSVAVRAALDRVTGTYSGVNVQSIAYMNEVIDFDEGQRAYNVSSDYDVRISRTDFEIAQGSPVTGTKLGQLQDVDTTGVTDGQVIKYNTATEEWLPATDAGGAEDLNDLTDVSYNPGTIQEGQVLAYEAQGQIFTATTIDTASTLEELTDVIITQPATGEVLKYDGNEWVNDGVTKAEVGLNNVDNTSDVNKPISTATQTALNAQPNNLRQLNDVAISGASTDQVLQYDGTDWVNATFNTATSLEDLTDVDLTVSIPNESLLIYNNYTGLWSNTSSQRLPSDGVFFHQRYETESEALRAGATATTELYFTCTADGNGLSESASSDTPTAGNVINRKIYYSEAGFADPDTGTWVEFTPAPADDATFATVKAALLEYLKARTGGTVPISLKQTWEEIPEATDLLDTYTGAAAGYSLRRIKSTATNAIRVRRSSDNEEQDIGFTAGELDTSSLLTFVGTGGTDNGYVKTWYDQSGNSNDATQTTTANQPQIVSSGAVIVENGKPAITQGSFLSSTFSTSISQPVSIYTTHVDLSSNFFHQGITNNLQLRGYTGKYQIFGDDGVQLFLTSPIRSALLNQQILLYNLYNGTGSKIAVNGATPYTGTIDTNGTSGFKINTQNITRQEFIIFEADDTNRTGIETNINTFYSIY